MVIWFIIFAILFILVIAVMYGVFIWNYLPNYKKIRIYVSTRDMNVVENQLICREISFGQAYSIEHKQDKVYKVCFSQLEKNKKVYYWVKLLKEGKYTVVLAQYDKLLKGNPMKYEQLDQFMMSKMDIKLK